MGYHRLSVILLAVSLAACSDDSSTSDPDPPTDAGADAEVILDAGPDEDAAPEVDQGPPSCTYQSDCETGTICHDGTCVATPACESLNNWNSCVDALEELDPELGKRAYCLEGYCTVACWKDAECPDGSLCTDLGQCKVSTAEVTGVHPGGDARAPLKVGISNVLMNFPIGVSAAGYGSRSESSSNQYAEDLYPSSGSMHGLYGRAIALDNGERQLLLVRMPIVFPTQQLHEEVARILQRETGADWRDSLIISGTHTHSGPGRHWPLPDDAAVSLGIFGTDSYSQQIFEMLRDSTAAAALEALDARQDARFGWKIVEAFDTDDLIASDRWKSTPPFDDNRLLLFRVDDLEGKPLAALVSYGSHGTWFETAYMTGDAPGAVERGLEERIGDTYGRHAPVLYFNENGGTMSPRGDRHGHSDTQKFDALGRYFADRVFAEFETIETKRDLSLDARTHRFEYGYEEIGYTADDWARPSTKTVSGTFWHGALGCNSSGDEDYETFTTPFNYFCLPAHALLQNRPATFMRRSMITALEIDGLTVVTIPGENSMETGYQVIRDLVNELGMDWRKMFVWGYAQDHQLYITPTNLRGDRPFFPGISTPRALDDYPDFAFSWLQGGYEPSLAIWGHRFGDFMVARAIEAVKLFKGENLPDVNTSVLPFEMSARDEEPFMIEDTPTDRVAAITQDMPAQVKRFEIVEFSWIGGDPGAEAPQTPFVRLTRRHADGSYAPLRSRTWAPYTNREPEMFTRVRPSSDNLHEWVVRWEELEDFPTGTYRFEVEGHYHDAGTRTPYTLESAPFEVVPSDTIVVDAAINAGAISGTLAYPATEDLSFTGDESDLGRVSGNYRMRHPLVGTGLPNPLDLGTDIDASGVTIRTYRSNGNLAETLTGADITLGSEMRSVGGRTIPVTTISATGSSNAVRIELDVTDQHGNTGTLR